MTSPQRVLILSWEYPPIVAGGLARHVRKLSENLVAEAAPAPEALPTTSWGSPRDLSTWEGPGVREFAWRARRAELDLLAAGRDATPRAVRELLALQSSDWAFLVQRDLAAAYGHARAEGHRAHLAAELSAVGSSAPELRGLAPHASPVPLLT